MKQNRVGTIMLAVLTVIIIVVAVLTQPKPRKLVNTLPDANRDLLTAQQIDILYNYSIHFPNETEISIALMDGDSVKYIGLKRQNDSLVFVENREKVFDIGSITKTFTGIALAKMVQSRTISMKEPIRNLLPIKLHESSMNGREITVADLASHTSGLPRDINDGSRATLPFASPGGNDRDKLYDYLSNRCQLNSTPGEKRSYSNLGYILLARILALTSHKTFEQLVSEAVTSPLHMKSTFVYLKERSRTNFVNGRDAHGGELEYSDPDENILGAGGVKSNAVDLVTYVEACIADTSYIALAGKSLFAEDEHSNSCMGWGFYRNGGVDYYGAFGNTEGFSAGIIFEKTTRVGLVFLSNISAYISAEGDYIPKLCRELHGSVCTPKLEMMRRQKMGTSRD